jgi:hypothetical protein
MMGAAMPFDGLGYITTHSKMTLWDRIAGLVWGAPKVPARALPIAFQPLPGEEADSTALRMLTIGRALIEERKDWVQRRYETRDGRRCAVGALRGAARLMHLHGPNSAANAILLSVAMRRGFNDIESMNDNSSHRQVLSAFDEAIARARR